MEGWMGRSTSIYLSEPRSWDLSKAAICKLFHLMAHMNYSNSVAHQKNVVFFVNLKKK